MRIVTFVKYVPDAAGDRSFESDNTVDRETDGLLSELDEYAIEEALNLTDKDKGSETIALTVGPAEAKDAVRKSLQMGADKGVHVLDDAISGADAVGTAKILAAAVRKVEADEGPVDLIITASPPRTDRCPSSPSWSRSCWAAPPPRRAPHSR
jgi:electron transfer flavoprotein beta subunit